MRNSRTSQCLTHGTKKKKTKKRKKRAEWTKQWLLRTNMKGLFDNLERTLSRRDGMYTNYLRMEPEHFDHFLLLAKEDLMKKDYCSIKFSVYCILPMSSFHH